MSVLLDSETRVCVQGITGPMGRFQTAEMLRSGTRVVAGISPGHDGERVEGVPVFNSLARARKEVAIDLSILYMAGPRATDAIFEAIDAGIPTIVCVAEFIPVHDMILVKQRLAGSPSRLVGPNTSGLYTPGQAKAGFFCADVCIPGDIGLMAKSGTLSYSVLLELKRAGLGISTAVGVGGDEIKGTTFRDCLELFERDPQTRATVLVGEIGGRDEEEAAEHIANYRGKPVVAFVAGRTIPAGQSIGHAGAIVRGTRGSYESKVRALSAAGARVARVIEEIPGLLSEEIANHG